MLSGNGRNSFVKAGFNPGFRPAAMSIARHLIISSLNRLLVCSYTWYKVNATWTNGVNRFTRQGSIIFACAGIQARGV